MSHDFFNREPSTFNKQRKLEDRHIRKTQPTSSSDSDEGDSVYKLKEGIPKRQSHGLKHTTQISGRTKRLDWDDDEDESYLLGDYYRSNRTGKSEAPTDMGATAEIKIDTQQDRDEQAIRDKLGKEQGGSSIVPFLYGQQKALSTRQRYGPQRAPLNIRSTTRWDFAPDICKDYKETGTCGFGDSCKFLHDRSDYKFGWQLEAEEDGRTYAKDDFKSYEIQDDKEMVSDDSAERICWECRSSFEDLVITKCDHYYCESCFLSKVVPQKECLSCGQFVDTNVKYAKKSKEHLQLQRQLVS